MKCGESIRLVLTAFLGVLIGSTCFAPLPTARWTLLEDPTATGLQKPQPCDCTCTVQADFEPRASQCQEPVPENLPKQTGTALVQKRHATSQAAVVPWEDAAFGWINPVEKTSLSMRQPESTRTRDVSDDFSDWLKANSDGVQIPRETLVDEVRHPDIDFIAAVLWLVFVISASMYFDLRHGYATTWTHICECVAIIAWLAFGLIMFCLAIEFESSHWKEERTLNLVEFTYLMAQIITTVGYGDIVPANRPGRICMGAFVLVGLLIIANLFSQASSAMVEQVENLGHRLRGQALQDTLSRAHNSKLPDPPDANSETQPESEGKWDKRLSHFFQLTRVETKLVHAALAYLAIGMIGALFFYMHEGKTAVEAVYMVIIASSSLGFGACTPTSRHGFAFTAFWMILACAAMCVLIGNFSQFMVVLERHHQSHLTKGRESFVEACEGVRQKDGDSVNLYEFSRLMLLYTQTVQLADLQCLEEIFQELNPDQNEHVKIDAIEQACYCAGEFLG